MQDINKIKEFYNNIYKRGDIRDNRRLYHWIMSLIRPPAHARLLDVGCGVGCLLNEANKKDLRVFGLDISYEALSKARLRLPTIKGCVADGEKIPFRNSSFDIVVSLGSIEHFLYPERGIREISRVLKKNEYAILLLPNSFSLENILKVLSIGKTEAQWQIQERLLTKEGWRSLIEENGLVVERIFGYNKFPELFKEGTFKVKSIKKYIRVFLLKHLCPLNFAWTFVYICRKANS